MKIDLSLGDTQLILQECDRNGLSTPQTAYVMATAWWETARTVKPVEEAYYLGEPRASRYREKLRYYPWHGRGYVQLTWEANYLKAGKKLDRDLTTDPDAVMNPAVAVEILVLGSLEGWFTGKKLGDYINKTKKDYVGARRIINGTDKAQAIADIATAYEDALDSYVAPVAAQTDWLAALWRIIERLFKK